MRLHYLSSADFGSEEAADSVSNASCEAPKVMAQALLSVSGGQLSFSAMHTDLGHLTQPQLFEENTGAPRCWGKAEGCLRLWVRRAILWFRVCPRHPEKKASTHKDRRLSPLSGFLW